MTKITLIESGRETNRCREGNGGRARIGERYLAGRGSEST